MSEEKRRKNLGTYAVIMVLAAVLLILIAAMADNREEHYEEQINQQTQLNVDIQNQIVRLEDENYKLKKETEALKTNSAEQEQALTVYQTLSEVYALALSGKEREAAERLKLKINDPSALTEEEKAAYDTLVKQLTLPME
ncbi:MAG: hypothetical protein J6A56_00840 [Clostridia bacterium]|nr:hypothetical protein [Clostridia bacterium]